MLFGKNRRPLNRQLDREGFPLEDLSNIVLQEQELGHAVRLLRRLIKVPSYDDESQVALLIANEMMDSGFKNVKIDKLYNVVGRIEGSVGSKTLLYVSHSDTSPPGRMKDAYSAKIVKGEKYGKKGEVIYGRGASGVKGALAAMILAGRLLRKNRFILMGELIVAATARTEQANHDGLRYLVKKDGISADMAVNGECTDNKIVLGSRGRVEFDVVVPGVVSHAGEPQKGVNAISGMAKFLNEISKMSLPTHKFIGKATITPVKIQSERKPYSIPDVCTTVIDRRTLPNERPGQVKDKVLDIVRQLRKKDPRFNAAIRISRAMYGQELSPSEPVVMGLRKAIRSAGGRPAIDYVRYSTDGSYLTTVAKIPTVTFGPGKLEDVLSSAEHIEMKSFIQGIRIYTINALQMLGCRGQRP